MNSLHVLQLCFEFYKEKVDQGQWIRRKKIDLWKLIVDSEVLDTADFAKGWNVVLAGVGVGAVGLPSSWC